jgi:hypothetical protein
VIIQTNFNETENRTENCPPILFTPTAWLMSSKLDFTSFLLNYDRVPSASPLMHRKISLLTWSTTALLVAYVYASPTGGEAPLDAPTSHSEVAGASVPLPHTTQPHQISPDKMALYKQGNYHPTLLYFPLY